MAKMIETLDRGSSFGVILLLHAAKSFSPIIISHISNLDSITYKITRR